MPTSAQDTVRKDVLYPDELAGRGFRASPGQLNGEIVYWMSEEDGEDLPDDARFGWWLPVEDTDEWTGWIASPKALREALLEVEIEPGEWFRIVSVDRGDDDHDPYEIEIEYPYET